ncbi:hypothetical protein [Stackebrandtia soli]|uniref:hypothetical protein n=1 Tax=Stackebrandtia soli TaxID=1892856 RepID=UPI0039ECF440
MPDDVMFRIRLNAEAEDAQPFATGRIEAPGLREPFRVPLGHWRIEDYLTSWRAELRRLKEGARHAVLLTMAAPVIDVDFLRGYILYREAEEIAIQESLLFADDLGSGFDLAHPSSAAPPHETETEEGIPVSEWIFPLSGLDPESAVGRYE